jgi:hypothetical protein
MQFHILLVFITCFHTLIMAEQIAAKDALLELFAINPLAFQPDILPKSTIFNRTGGKTGAMMMSLTDEIILNGDLRSWKVIECPGWTSVFSLKPFIKKGALTTDAYFDDATGEWTASEPMCSSLPSERDGYLGVELCRDLLTQYPIKRTGGNLCMGRQEQWLRTEFSGGQCANFGWESENGGALKMLRCNKGGTYSRFKANIGEFDEQLPGILTADDKCVYLAKTMAGQFVWRSAPIIMNKCQPPMPTPPGSAASEVIKDF